jgi:O-antigen/teichoic acid export membrane protein
VRSEQSFAHRVMSDGLYTFVVRIANVVAAAVLGILTARLLGPEGKGTYALPMIQAAIVATAFAGLTSATSYFLLNGDAGNRRTLAVALRASVPFLLGGAVGVLAIGAFGAARWAIPAAIASLPASAAISIVTGYVIGIKRVRYATTITIACTIANLALAAFGLFLVARTPTVAIAAWLVSLNVIAAIALAATIRHAHRSPAAGAKISTGSFLRLAAKVGSTGVVTLLNYRADLYVVAIFLPTSALGLYTVAISAAESLLIPTQIAALVTSPHIGSLPASEASRLAARCVRNNLLAAIVICSALFAFSPPLIRLLYGASFLPLVPALRVLLIGVFALSLGSPISNYFTLKLAKPEVTLAIASGSAILCIVASVLLIPHFGLVGAAAGSTIAYVAGQGAGLWYFSRTTQVGWAAMFIPTRADFAQYRSFATARFK